MKRLSLATCMAAVGFSAIGFAALTHPTELWASGLFTLAITILTWASVAAVSQRRAFWAGFAAFGWVYLILSLGMFGVKGTPLASFPPPPPLITTKLVDLLERKAMPESSIFDTVPSFSAASLTPTLASASTPFTITFKGQPDLTHTYFHQAAHSLMSLLVALAGGILVGITMRNERRGADTADD